jgi:hypothetical protein
MSVKKILVLVVALLGIAANAYAAEKTREFSIDGTYMKTTDQQSLSMLNVSLGQFLTTQMVIVTNLSTLDNYGYTSTSIGLGGKYYFMDGLRGDLVPFAGVGIALRQYSASGSNSSSTQYDINGGVSYFMTDVTTLDAKAKLMSFSQPDGSHATTTVFSVGFTQRF